MPLPVRFGLRVYLDRQGIYTMMKRPPKGQPYEKRVIQNRIAALENIIRWQMGLRKHKLAQVPDTVSVRFTMLPETTLAIADYGDTFASQQLPPGLRHQLGNPVEHARIQWPGTTLGTELVRRRELPQEWHQRMQRNLKKLITRRPPLPSKLPPPELLSGFGGDVFDTSIKEWQSRQKSKNSIL